MSAYYHAGNEAMRDWFVGVLFGVVLLIARPWIGSIFSDDPAVVELAGFAKLRGE